MYDLTILMFVSEAAQVTDRKAVVPGHLNVVVVICTVQVTQKREDGRS